jgi:predicted nucleic acid-binding protein
MFLDTSGLYALLDASEVRHEPACREFARAAAPFTHAYVLAEIVPLAQVRGLSRSVTLAFVSALIESGEVEVVWAGRELHQQAHRLLLARSDKTYSLCDAASFILMRERGEGEALTTDHHFEQEGFVRLLAGRG